ASPCSRQTEWAGRRFSIIPAILGAKWGWMLGCVFTGGFRRGSCVHDKNKILLNIKLIMAPTNSIEYVVMNDRDEILICLQI
ncbi:MAG: putative metal-dependent hydrolase, partial [Candidatus Methanocomedens sp.]